MLLDGSTAVGGDECEPFAWGQSSGSVAFSSSCSPSPFSASLPFVWSAWAEPSAVVGSEPLEEEE